MKIDKSKVETFILELGRCKIRFLVEYRMSILTKVEALEPEKLKPENMFWFWKWIPLVKEILEAKVCHNDFVKIYSPEEMEKENLETELSQ